MLQRQPADMTYRCLQLSVSPLQQISTRQVYFNVGDDAAAFDHHTPGRARHIAASLT